jgi:hypothetical protein
MATESMYLDGKAKFVRVFEPDMKFQKWQVLLYPDAPSLDKIRKLQDEGIKNKLKLDDDGYNMTFSRPTFREDKKNGLKIPYAPPIVKEKDGKTDFSRVIKIGDGSDVHIGLEVYDHAQPGTTKTAKAARLKSLRVDNLVPDSRFVPTAEEEEEIGMQPKAIF